MVGVARPAFLDAVVLAEPFPVRLLRGGQYARSPAERAGRLQCGTNCRPDELRSVRYPRHGLYELAARLECDGFLFLALFHTRFLGVLLCNTSKIGVAPVRVKVYLSRGVKKYRERVNRSKFDRYTLFSTQRRKEARGPVKRQDVYGTGGLFPSIDCDRNHEVQGVAAVIWGAACIFSDSYHNGTAGLWWVRVRI